MVATLCLLSCVLATGQVPERPPSGAPAPHGGRLLPPAEGGDWLVVPRLTKGQELLYRGSFTEEDVGNGVQFQRCYRVEHRVFVLDTPPQGIDAAFLTVLRLRTGAGERHEDAGASSARVELGHVTLQGRVEPPQGTSLLVPLDGPPTAECGAFVEVPHNRLGLNQTWTVTEEGRPLRNWQVAGTEAVNGTSCLKLTGVQQSDDWEQPRTNHAAWRRQDTVWMAPRLGIAYRVERVLERREPASQNVTHRSVLRYELENPLPYPGQLYEDRKQEILQARNFFDAAAPLLRQPAKYGPQLDALLARINQHLEHNPPTPYREAIQQIKRRAEAARRGESPPAPLPEENPATAPQVIAVGTPAPDFLAPDFGGRDSLRLQRWLGKPVVLVFYNPTSVTAEELLRFAQAVQSAHAQELQVVGLAMSDDAELVRKQRDRFRLTFPLLNGTALRMSYAVDTTPKLVVLDPKGVVRGSYVGWGHETPEGVLAEVQRWLPPDNPERKRRD
jgi:peroxiredoxin